MLPSKSADIFCGKASSGTATIEFCYYTGVAENPFLNSSGSAETNSKLTTAIATKVTVDDIIGDTKLDAFLADWTERNGDVIVPSSVAAFAPKSALAKEGAADTTAPADTTVPPVDSETAPGTTPTPAVSTAPNAETSEKQAETTVASAETTVSKSGGCSSATLGLGAIIAVLGLAYTVICKKDN